MKRADQVVVDLLKKKNLPEFLKNWPYNEKICIAFSTSSGVSGFILLLEPKWAKFQKSAI